MTGLTHHAPRAERLVAGQAGTCQQDWGAYTTDEHALWQRLYQRQSALVPRHACREFREALAGLACGEGIPRFDAVSDRLERATGWRIEPVAGLLPDRAFFELLAGRRFPVTVWIRRPEEFDYIVEPDVFHDFFGHVPMLFNPVFAHYLEAYGRGGLKADRLGAIEMLARLYWHTVEFGLIETPEGVRAYGAGLLSSAGELPYSVESPVPPRVRFDLLRLLRTRYRIDDFQPAYFVIRDFAQLFEATAPDFTPYYEQLRGAHEVEPGALLPTDHLL